MFSPLKDVEAPMIDSVSLHPCGGEEGDHDGLNSRGLKMMPERVNENMQNYNDTASRSPVVGEGGAWLTTTAAVAPRSPVVGEGGDLTAGGLEKGQKGWYQSRNVPPRGGGEDV